MKIILRAVARCESAIEDQSQLLKEIWHSLQKDREQHTSKSDAFASMTPNLPIDSLNSFNELNEKLESDSAFEKLMVNKTVNSSYQVWIGNKEKTRELLMDEAYEAVRVCSLFSDNKIVCE